MLVKSIAWGIPCYNAADVIGRTPVQLLNVARKLTQEPNFFHLHLYDDGSTDKTPAVIKNLSIAHLGQVTAVSSARNRGVAQVIPDLYSLLWEYAQTNQAYTEQSNNPIWKSEETIFGRCDPSEHDVTKLPILIDAIKAGASGAIGCVEYTTESLGGGLHGQFDLDAHNYLGRLEGMIALAGKQTGEELSLTEKYLRHHCPGYQVFPGSIFGKIVSLLPKYQDFYEKVHGHPARWGMDLVVAAIASRLSDGNVAVVNVGPSTVSKQKRPIPKILAQLHDAANQLLTFLEWEKTVNWSRA